MRYRFAFLLTVAWAAGVADARAAAPRVWVVRDGKAAADVYAGPAEWETAERFAARIEQWTGVKLALFGTSGVPAGRRGLARVVIGTARSSLPVGELAGLGAADGDLGDQGYVLRATADPPAIVACGMTPTAALYAVGELLNYRLEVEKNNVWCEPFRLAERPALPHRWLWLSTSYAHWDPAYGGPHVTDEVAIEPPRYPGQFLGRTAYLATYQALIDWMGEHRLNGALIFGYLNQGVGPARQVARYGRDHGVDVLAGVGTMGYWGAYYGGRNEYNLDALMELRPELFRRDARGRLLACPSRPDMRRYWKEAGGWLARTLPELGGLYLENGDLQTCPCDDCRRNRARAENDTGCYWDMAASEVPVIEGARAVRADWKFVYATYTAFTPAGLRRGTARTPPRFPRQFPPSAICQWTVTGLGAADWPTDLRAPTAHSVGLIHSPSVWGRPDGPGRWWAGPGSSHDDASGLVRLYCERMAATGFEGLVVKGMKNAHSPGPLLTYLALEEFSWHPHQTAAGWERDRLARLFGGAERAVRYLRLARDGTRGAAARQRLVGEAAREAADPALSPRARPYWEDLAEEMRYRRRLEATLPAVPAPSASAGAVAPASGSDVASPPASGKAFLVRDGKSAYQIVTATSASEPERFAAAELARYLGAMSGARLPVGTGPAGERALVFGAAVPAAVRRRLDGQPEDAFLLRTEGTRVYLAGASPRATLYAAYAFLEGLGVGFPRPGQSHLLAQVEPPGPQEETVPRRRTIPLPALDRLEKPALTYRGLVLFPMITERSVREIDWMAKNRLNWAHLITNTDLAEWDRQRVRAVLLPELRKRGLHVQGVGHSFFAFVPPEVYAASHPEYFAEVGGKRQVQAGRGGLCVSNPEVARVMAERVGHFLDDNPEIEIIDLWANDSNVWCQCPRCRAEQGLAGTPAPYTTTTRSYLRFVNRVAGLLAAKHPKVKVNALAYALNMQPDPETRPAANVIVGLAPWGRIAYAASDDYYVPITEPGRVNRAVYRALRGWLRQTGDVYLYDYYANRFEFFPIIETLRRDYAHYQQLGLRQVSTEIFLWPEFNLWAYARLAWDPAVPLDRLIADFCRVAYRDAAGSMERFYATLERAKWDWPKHRTELGGLLTQAEARAARDATVRAKLARLRQALATDPAKSWEHPTGP